MIGLHLCNLDLIEWLGRLDAGMPKDAVSVPEKRFPVIIRHRLQQMHLHAETTADFMASAERIVFWDVPNLEVDHADDLLTVVHAMACAGIVSEAGDVEINRLVHFIEGKERWGDAVPETLTRAGVYSCMHRRDAIRIEAWIGALDQKTFEYEVEGMYGDVEVDYYCVVKESIARVFRSTQTHGMDLCLTKDLKPLHLR